MKKTSNEAAPYRPETIGIRQLAVEVSLGLRSPVTIRAGAVSGGRPGRQLERLYAAMRVYKAETARRMVKKKEG